MGYVKDSGSDYYLETKATGDGVLDAAPAGAKTVPIGSTVDFGANPSAPAGTRTGAQRNGGGSFEAATTGTQPPGAVSPLAARYATSAAGTTPDPITSARDSLAAQLTKGSAAPDQQKIRDQVAQNMQAQIDATNQFYNGLVAQHTQEGQVRSNQTRGINVRSGLSGSDFASANADATTQANDKVLSADEAARQAKLDEINGTIDSRALDLYTAQSKAATDNAASLVTLLGQTQTQARQDVLDLGAAGTTIDQLKQDPARFQKLLEQTGYTEAELALKMNQARNTATKIDYKVQDLGNGKVLFYGFDPTKSGKDSLSQFTVDGNVPPGSTPVYQDGTLYYKDAKGVLTPAPIGDKDLASPIKEYNQAKQLGLIPKDTTYLQYQTSKAQATHITVSSDDPTINDIAEGLVNGTKAPSQLSKRGGDYYKIMAKADEISMAQNGVPFDAVTAEQQFNYGNNQQTQTVIQAGKTALQTIQRAITASNGVQRSDLTWVNGAIVGGKRAMGDPATAIFVTDANALSDEIGQVLGGGSATDFKTKLGQIITDTSLSNEQFSASMNELASLFTNKINGVLNQAGKPNLPATSSGSDDLKNLATKNGYSSDDVDSLRAKGYTDDQIKSLITQ